MGDGLENQATQSQKGDKMKSYTLKFKLETANLITIPTDIRDIDQDRLNHKIIHFFKKNAWFSQKLS